MTGSSTETRRSDDPGEDLTGRDRIIWNTTVSWLSQLIVIIAGFALPRLMHESLGQTMLGIWDFAWTFVNYFNLMSLGIGSSVNRFVAKFRAEGKAGSLNEVVSTVVLVQLCITGLVVLVTLAVCFAVEVFYSDKLGSEVPVAQWVVFLLGMSLATEMLTNSARGVITGHHRWDVHNAIYAGSSLLSLTLMAGALLAGSDLTGVAAAYFLSTMLTEGLRVFLAVRIAPDIKIQRKLFSFSQAKDLVIFGTKTLLLAFPQVVLVQTVNLITVTFLGPAALAVFARPFALIRHLYTLVYKFTMILTPTAGSMQATEDQQQMREFFKDTLKFNFSISVPAIAFFLLFGDFIMLVWMGEDYRNWQLVVILSAGHLLAIGQDGIIRIMQGLDKHGRLAIWLFVSVLLSASACFIWLNQFPWTLASSALLLTIPMTIAFGLVLPVYSCRILGIGLIEYSMSALMVPVILNLPFIAGLYASRVFLVGESYLLASAAFALANLIELVVYYIFLLPEPTKQRLIKKWTSR